MTGERGKTKPMLDNLRLCFGCVSVLVGSYFLRDGVSNAHSAESTWLLGGAVLVSLGFISMAYVVKNWVELRKYFKNDGG
jgi:hypothetical protein